MSRGYFAMCTMKFTHVNFPVQRKLLPDARRYIADLQRDTKLQRCVKRDVMRRRDIPYERSDIVRRYVATFA